MADRKVTGVERNGTSRIMALCGPWGRGGAMRGLSITRVANDICDGKHTYYVLVGRVRVDIHVYGSGTNRSLRTDRDYSCENNLRMLPPC